MVTGASAGLGRAIALEFAGRGDAVALMAREVDRLRGAAAGVAERGGPPLWFRTDVADFEAVSLAARRVEDELGPIGVWVNNAMSSVFAPFADVTMDESTGPPLSPTWVSCTAPAPPSTP